MAMSGGVRFVFYFSDGQPELYLFQLLCVFLNFIFSPWSFTAKGIKIIIITTATRKRLRKWLL